MSCFSGLASAASVPVPIAVSPGPVNPENCSRRSVDFPPDIWGDHFLAYSSNVDLDNESDEMLEHEKLKQEVRKMITVAIEDPTRNLDLVDWIQRLGVSYHFQEEIEELLLKMLANLDEYVDNNVDDLHKISLCFRLLRQQGYNVSSEMFSNFKDDEGNFKESLNEDIEGLLSLYEASHLRIHGEDILEYALSFSVTQLKFLIMNLSTCPLSTRVNHALKYPMSKNLPRLGARFYISTYQDMPSHNEKILKFSKLDFSILQKEHQRELSQISSWDSNLATQLPKCMKTYYLMLLDVYNRIGDDLGVQGKPYWVDCIREELASWSTLIMVLAVFVLPALYMVLAGLFMRS